MNGYEWEATELAEKVVETMPEWMTKETMHVKKTEVKHKGVTYLVGKIKTDGKSVKMYDYNDKRKKVIERTIT